MYTTETLTYKQGWKSYFFHSFNLGKDWHKEGLIYIKNCVTTWPIYPVLEALSVEMI